MNLFNFTDFLAYSKFVDSQVVTEKIYESNQVDAPDDKTKKKAARIKVEYAGQLLSNKFPFFAEILFSQQIIYTYDPRIPTAATDGQRIFINPNFFFPMTQKQVLFVLAHEVMHTALLHTVRQYSRDHKRWNIAGDHEINLLLAGEQIIPLSEITGELQGYADEKYKGKSAEEIYNDPNLEIGPAPSTSGGQPGDGQPGDGQPGSGEPGDSQPGSGQPGEEQEGGGQSGEEQEGGDQPGDGQPGSGQPGSGAGDETQDNEDGVKGHSEHPITEIRGPKTGEVITKAEGDSIARGEGIDPGDNSGLPSESEDQLKDKVRSAAQRHLSPRNKNKGSGNDGDIYQKIMELTEPKVNWRQALSRFIGRLASKSEFKMPNRRFVARGEYRHSLVDEYQMLKSAAVAMDVSGSIMENFPELAAEVVGIVKAKKIKTVHVVPFADNVVTPFDIKGSKKPTRSDFEKVRTGGGTEAIGKVIDYINEKTRKKPDFVVIMTDGHLTRGLPEKRPPWAKKIIWLIFDNPSFEVGPEWGTVIHANQDKGYYGN